jgi:hypothetical protein
VITNEGTVVAEISRHGNPVVLKFTMKILNEAIDRRLLLAMGIMMVGIEGRE